MTIADITSRRLYNQHISQPDFTSAHDVVAWLGAMQAQDYPGAKWSIALRMAGNVTEADIERAITERQIVRTWPMRGTLHFVAPEDIRWMLALLAPKMIAGAASRRRNLDLDEATMARATDLIVRALEGDNVLTRKQLCQVLDDAGITTAGQRGIHILANLSQQAVLCYGPHSEKEPTFVLLDEWLPPTPPLERDEALARLAGRFVASHGPATDQDLARWAGMSLGDARRGLEAVRSDFRHETVDGLTYWFPDVDPPDGQKSSVYLLPGFDEYILGYKDRSLMIEAAYSQKIVPGNNGMFIPTIIVDGQVAGTWKRTNKKAGATITLLPFTKLTPAQHQSAAQVVESYAKYLGIPATLSL